MLDKERSLTKVSKTEKKKIVCYDSLAKEAFLIYPLVQFHLSKR